MNKIQIIDKVFKTQPQIISNCSADVFNKYVKGIVPDFKPNDYSGVGTVVCRTNKDGVLNRFVWVMSLKRNAEDIATLSHELFHLVIRVMADKGVPVSERAMIDETAWNGDEAASYLYEFYMLECMKKVLTDKRYK